MRPAWFALLLAACEVSAAPPPTDPVEDARLAIRTSQFARAVEILQQQSRAGSVEADYLLGLAAWTGSGMDADRAAAKAALERAAHRDHARAQYALAALLAQEPQGDRAAAESWLRRAAAAGYTPAVAMRDSARLPLDDPRSDRALGVDLRFEIASYAARSANPALLRELDLPQLVNRRDSFGRTLLAMAAEAGARASVQPLLQGGAAVESADNFGVTPLMLAVRRPDQQLTAELLAAGARVGTRDHVGRDALNYAATANQAGQVSRLIDAGAKIDGVDSQGGTATDAAQRSQADAALVVLRAAGGKATVAASPTHDQGIDPTRTGALYAGWPPLLVAAAHDDAADIRRRVAAGTPVDVASPRGETALQVAIDARASNAVRALLELGANPLHDAGGANCLERGVRSGNGGLLGVLLERASLSRAESGRLLQLAVQRGDVAAASLLIGKGASVDDPDAAGMRPLARAARLGDAAMIKLLTDRGAAAGAVDANGRSALWYAAGARDPQAAAILLRMRVPIDAADRAGVTPLLAAIRAGNENLVRSLVEAGAAVDARKDARDPPLRVAAEVGNRAAVELLLERKADVDATDQFGETALMAAARSGDEALCGKLLSAGANPRLRGRDRSTAGDIAAARGFTALAERLRS